MLLPWLLLQSGLLFSPRLMIMMLLRLPLTLYLTLHRSLLHQEIGREWRTQLRKETRLPMLLPRLLVQLMLFCFPRLIMLLLLRKPLVIAQRLVMGRRGLVLVRHFH